MSLATLTPGAGMGLLSGPAPSPRTQQVGPDWEVLLMPEPLARSVLAAIAGTAAESAVGWVFAHGGAWGIFLPALSGDPAWPPGTTYLKAGGHVTLPPVTWRFVDGDRTSGWVDLTGSPLSRPLLLHPVVTLLARDATCPSPVPEP